MDGRDIGGKRTVCRERGQYADEENGVRRERMACVEDGARWLLVVTGRRRTEEARLLVVVVESLADLAMRWSGPTAEHVLY